MQSQVGQRVEPSRSCPNPGLIPVLFLGQRISVSASIAGHSSRLKAQASSSSYPVSCHYPTPPPIGTNGGNDFSFSPKITPTFLALSLFRLSVFSFSKIIKGTLARGGVGGQRAVVRQSVSYRLYVLVLVLVAHPHILLTPGKMNAINATEKFQTLTRRNYEIAEEDPGAWWPERGFCFVAEGVCDSVLNREQGEVAGGRGARAKCGLSAPSAKALDQKKGAPPETGHSGP